MTLASELYKFYPWGYDIYPLTYCSVNVNAISTSSNIATI